jgi:hypothetical protein
MKPIDQFIELCKKGDLVGSQQLFQLNPGIGIGCVFPGICSYGHLHIAQWLLQVKPDINISGCGEQAFRFACHYGHLHIAQWLLQVSKERGQCINISIHNNWAFHWACKNRHLHVAKWLQTLNPYLYVIEYDEKGKIKSYRIREKEEENWERRKYFVWLASNHCPEENKNNLLYKLPSDISRMVIGFV